MSKTFLEITSNQRFYMSLLVGCEAVGYKLLPLETAWTKFWISVGGYEKWKRPIYDVENVLKIQGFLPPFLPGAMLRVVESIDVD